LPKAPFRRKFQFQHGAIKSKQIAKALAVNAHFNSNMVRLKAHHSCRNKRTNRISIPTWCD